MLPLLTALLLTPAHGADRIVGGHPVASPDIWPDAAAIIYENQFGCTGVLIAPTVVLTAAHCVDEALVPTAVRLGILDYTVPGGETIAVQTAVAHPSFVLDEAFEGRDIAILILATPATITPRVIAHGCAATEVITNGAPATIVGWGALNVQGTEYEPFLREASTFVSDPNCEDTEMGCVPEISPGGELRAAGNGVDACYGDSGGPLYLDGVSPALLGGVVSRGDTGWTEEEPCGAGGIWVRPDAVVDWIESTAGVTLPVPTCAEPPDDPPDDPPVDEPPVDEPPVDEPPPEIDREPPPQIGTRNTNLAMGGGNGMACNATASQTTGLWLMVGALLMRRRSTS